MLELKVMRVTNELKSRGFETKIDDEVEGGFGVFILNILMVHVVLDESDLDKTDMEICDSIAASVRSYIHGDENDDLEGKARIDPKLGARLRQLEGDLYTKRLLKAGV